MGFSDRGFQFFYLMVRSSDWSFSSIFVGSFIPWTLARELSICVHVDAYDIVHQLGKGSAAVGHQPPPPLFHKHRGCQAEQNDRVCGVKDKSESYLRIFFRGFEGPT